MNRRDEGKIDVLFRAEEFRPQWLGYGAGLLVGGWTALVSGLALWKAFGWLGLLVWPLVWALGVVMGAQVVFGLGSMIVALLRLPKRWCRGCVSGLILLVLSVLAYRHVGFEAGFEAGFEHGLGWGWFVVVLPAVMAGCLRFRGR
jgi:hypothetical protein